MQMLLQDLRYRADRIKFYGESFTDWAVFCEEAAETIENECEHAHDECCFEDQVNELVDENNDLRADIDRLKSQLAELKAKPPRRRRKPLPDVLPEHIVRVDFERRVRA